VTAITLYYYLSSFQGIWSIVFFFISMDTFYLIYLKIMAQDIKYLTESKPFKKCNKIPALRYEEAPPVLKMRVDIYSLAFTVQLKDRYLTGDGTNKALILNLPSDKMVNQIYLNAIFCFFC